MPFDQPSNPNEPVPIAAPFPDVATNDATDTASLNRAPSDAAPANTARNFAPAQGLQRQALQRQATQAHELQARRLRLVEWVLVVFVAFAMPIFSSFYILLVSGKVFKSIPNGRTSTAQIIWEMSGLAVLFYVLFRRNQPIASLMKPLSWRDAAPTVGVFLAAMIGTTCYHYFWNALFPSDSAIGHSPPLTSAGGVSVAVVLFLIVNAIFEELIARAWTISEIEYLYGNTRMATGIAVACSVLMQASYHLYQGLASALATAVIFLVFSVYYVRTRRIWPVILAHMAVDFLALGATVLRHAPHK